MIVAWLVRHAESESNAGSATSDPRTIRLTSRGHAQAYCVADAITDTPRRIVTTPFCRTWETAVPTLERFPEVPHEEWPLQEFTYLALERCRQTTAMERKPFVGAYWSRSDIAYCDGPGAETFTHFINRIQSARIRLAAMSSVPLLIFTHSYVIHAFYWLQGGYNIKHLDPRSMRQFRSLSNQMTIPNAAIIPLHQTYKGLFCGNIQINHLPSLLLTY